MRYVLFHKPFNILSQFTGDQPDQTLASFRFPKGVYAAGRLDKDSEGLLFLTDDGKLKHRLLDPRFHHERSYLVQVEGTPDTDSVTALQKGVVLDGKKTRPARIRIVGTPLSLPDRNPPIRYRKTIPTSWMEIILTEGKNRQVRRMTASVGHPTLRLIRTRILFLTLNGLNPGEWRELAKAEIRRLQTEVGL